MRSVSKVNELVEIVSFLSGKPTRSTAQVEVDTDSLIDLAGELVPVRASEAAPESSADAAEDKDA
jgi:hypothetical protein